MRALPMLAVALWPGLTAAAAEVGHRRSFIVRVYNYAGVSDKTLSNAELTARRIFRRAGVETEWIGCPKDRREEPRYTACQTPPSAADMVLSVVPQSMEGYEVPQKAFGFALPSGDDRPARHAYVFYRRVEQVIRQSDKVSLATLLGYVMVHETTHLLLGPSMHLDRGIMRPHWAPQDLREMESGALAFPPKQARLLRVKASERATLALADWTRTLGAVSIDAPPEP